MVRKGLLALFLGLLVFLGQPAWFAAGGVMVAPRTVRVGLLQQAGRVGFTVDGNYQLIDRYSNQPVAEIKPGQRWEVHTDPYGMKLYRDGISAGSFAGPLLVRPQESPLTIISGKEKLSRRSSGLTVQGAGNKKVQLNSPGGVSVLGASGQKRFTSPDGLHLITLEGPDLSRRYRGEMEFRAGERGLTVINQLPIEEYLYGVVPAEMPASWPVEALKAQAVACRTYVLASLGTYEKQGFDVLATQSSQVYRGYDGENPATTRAVDETRGVVATYRGRPISAVFHSSSGGYTENSEDVWTNPVDYLRTRPDPYDKNEQHYNWSVTYSAEQLRQQLAAAGYQFSVINDLEIISRTASGARVKCLEVRGLDISGRPLTVPIANADRVRMALGIDRVLKTNGSALFTMEKVMSGGNGGEGGSNRAGAGGRDIPGGQGRGSAAQIVPGQTGAGQAAAGGGTGTSQPAPVTGQPGNTGGSRLVSVTFRGSGWGHGLGMSQFGARGMAAQGYNYQEILKYYYTGIAIDSDYGG